MQHLQEEIDEDTTAVIPSAVYKAQLYHNVTKIKWDHRAEPHILRGGILFKCLETPGHGARGGCKADGSFLMGQCWTLGSAGCLVVSASARSVRSALHSREGFCWSSCILRSRNQRRRSGAVQGQTGATNHVARELVLPYKGPPDERGALRYMQRQVVMSDVCRLH
ncbi:UNVERIFIED_CONTAM: hypothetical protein FKN15_015523 [Acipenser sinensis]